MPARKKRAACRSLVKSVTRNLPKDGNTIEVEQPVKAVYERWVANNTMRLTHRFWFVFCGMLLVAMTGCTGVVSTGYLEPPGYAEAYVPAPEVVVFGGVDRGRLDRGYLFRILTSQGRAAPGGRSNCMVHGNLTAGFALVAYPERWGKSGIMTFIVNQEGKVYQQNLGEKTAKIATRMTRYNPNGNWTLVPEPGMSES